jgi:hypothetical protein
MQTRSVVTLGVLAAGLLLARPAAASGEYPELALVVVGALVLPSDVGTDIPATGESRARVVVGWSYQVPLGSWKGELHHRAVFGADLLFVGGFGGRGRVGYRYATQWLFAGAGVSATGDGPTWSPEVGVKFAHLVKGESQSLHVLVRGEVAPDLQQLQGATVLLGWNLL